MLSRYGKINRKPGGIFGAYLSLVGAMAGLFMAGAFRMATRAAGDGRVARRPQTTARHGETFLESTAKYTMNMYDVSGVPFGTAVVNQPLKAVPGYISRLRVKVQASAGTGAAAVAAADAPWNVIQSIRVYDASGYPVYQADGIGARFIDMASGQTGPGPYADPQARPSFSNIAATGNFTFAFDIPFELGSGYGAIAGANQSRVPSLQIFLNPAATVYSTLPTGVPTLGVRVDAEFYGAPLDDPSKAPPGNGSSVQWSMAQGANAITSGSNIGVIVPAPNLTGYLGTLIALARNASNVREDGWLTGTNDVELWIDQQLRMQETFDQVADRLAAAFGWGLTSQPTRPSGVLVYTFRDSVYPKGPVSLDNLALWEPTDTGTLVEVRSGAWGTITGGPDTLTFYTQRLYPRGDVPYGPEFD